MARRVEAGGQLQYRKLADEVAELLQKRIVDGELASGQRVTQDGLAEMLGVSTMPIREALLKLTALGLVEAQANRSFRITTTTADDLRDLYWIYGVLSGELTKRACAAHGDAIVPELRVLETAYVEAATSGDIDDIEQANSEFHAAINRAAGSRRLLFIMKATLNFVPEGWYHHLEQWIPLSKIAHGKIIDAFVANDPEEAGRAATAHVVEEWDLFSEHLAENGRWGTAVAPPEES
jgi:DNA-binding GntR family transcriptional regulator